jgi:hypothetical protein
MAFGAGGSGGDSPGPAEKLERQEKIEEEE